MMIMNNPLDPALSAASAALQREYGFGDYGADRVARVAVREFLRAMPNFVLHQKAGEYQHGSGLHDLADAVERGDGWTGDG